MAMTVHCDVVSAEEQIFSVVITEINEMGHDEAFTFYPNPARDVIIVNEELEYKVFNISGQEVMNGISSGNKINVNSLEDGIYFILLSDETGTKVQKLIIE